MKIAYVLEEYPSLSEQFIAREIQALQAKGLQISVLALRKGRSELLGGEPGADPLDVTYAPTGPGAWLSILKGWHGFSLTAQRALLLSLELARTPGRGFLNCATAFHFASAAQDRGIRHIHAHFAFRPADVAAATASLLDTGYSVSVHARDLYTQDARTLGPKLLPAKFVAACTQHGHDRLCALLPDLPREKVTLAHHGVDPARFEPRHLKRSAMILAVGRLVEKKGFCYLVDACRELDRKAVRFTCRIVGDGPLRQVLQQQIDEADLETKVELTGELGQDELRRLYSEACMLVAPSITAADGDTDGIPNVILEAMALETPVVAFQTGGIPEVVSDGKNGCLVPPGDVPALSSRMQSLLADPDLRARLGHAGRNTILDRFDAAKNAEALASLFRANSLRPAGGLP